MSQSFSACRPCTLIFATTLGLLCRTQVKGSFIQSAKNNANNRFFQLQSMTTYANPPLIDVDCNLWHKDLTTLLPGDKELSPWNILLEDGISKANIVAVLSPSSTIKEAKDGLTKLREGPAPPLQIKTTVGVHPYHVNDDELRTDDDHVGTIMRDLLKDHDQFCAAVGECGLDASEGFPPMEDQIPWFRKQTELADRLQLPLFVHERLAFDNTMAILKDVTVPVIIHCFTGTQEECKQYIARGYYISVSGYILKDNADNAEAVRSCLSEGIIPLDRLMIETDSPYMGFTNCRERYVEHNQEIISSSMNSKKRKRLAQSIYPNVPSSLVTVLDKVVKCLQQNDSTLTRDKVADATTANAKKFFGFTD